MKKILITGANSYIGTSFQKYIQENNYADAYTVTVVDMVDGTWREKDFSGYDSVFHVAGIAHSHDAKISEEKEKQYYAINTDLAIETAKKAKEDGVRQFVFMSSMMVYGNSAPIGKQKIITKDTPISPANCYGDSKWQAECGLQPLADESFCVAILRSPMIYGRGSKGNYSRLSRIAQKSPVFPKVSNQRSMCYVENLCEFVRLLVEHLESGVFFPQNAEYSNTSDLVRMIAEVHGKKIKLLSGMQWMLMLAGRVTTMVEKAFGNLVYDMALSEYSQDYRVHSLSESIRRTEGEL